MDLSFSKPMSPEDMEVTPDQEPGKTHTHSYRKNDSCGETSPAILHPVVLEDGSVRETTD